MYRERMFCINFDAFFGESAIAFAVGDIGVVVFLAQMREHKRFGTVIYKMWQKLCTEIIRKVSLCAEDTLLERIWICSVLKHIDVMIRFYHNTSAS